MDVVFASSSALRDDFVSWLMGIAMMAVVYGAVIAFTEEQSGPLAWKRGGAMLGLALLVVTLWVGYATVYGRFLRLTVHEGLMVLRYAGVLGGTRLIRLEDVDSVVIGGGPSRGSWYWGCHVRLWLKGGGSLVSVRSYDMSKEQCQRLRSDLVDVLKTKEKAP